MSSRNWREYNAALVKRGEVLLDFSMMDGWKRELVEMNERKEGGRYQYPDSLIRLLAFIHVYLRLPYRQLEGFVRMLARYVDGVKAPDYSSMAWRIQRLDVTLNDAFAESDEEVVIAVDASGIKVANRGDWIRHKWKVRRGFLKIHVAVDVRSKRILAMEVTKEKVADGRRLKRLVTEASHHAKITKAIGDGGYDTKKNFRYLAGKDIEPVIKVRKNSSGKARGCMPRKLVAQEYLRDPEAWKHNHGYGYRWMAESALSSLKRTLGEYVQAKTMQNMVNELMLKASLYNLLIGLTASP